MHRPSTVPYRSLMFVITLVFAAGGWWFLPLDAPGRETPAARGEVRPAPVPIGPHPPPHARR